MNDTIRAYLHMSNAVLFCIILVLWTRQPAKNKKSSPSEDGGVHDGWQLPDGSFAFTRVFGTASWFAYRVTHTVNLTGPGRVEQCHRGVLWSQLGPIRQARETNTD